MPCSVPNCPSPVLARELCRKHYYRLRRTGTTDLLDRKNYCAQDGCDQPAHGDGLCAKHYARSRRHGDPSVRLRQRDPGPDETRWMQKVAVESPGCWIWTAGKDGQGYGAYAKVRIHQYVWTLLVGPVPEGMELDHLCRVRACCNPDHLQPVPHVTNVRRGSTGGRIKNTEEARAQRAAYMRDYMRRRRAQRLEAQASD